MSASDFARVLARELASLKAEILAYPDDDAPWVLPPGAPNSGGTLVLHVCGNLRHNVGAGLGGSGYVRDREAEFTTRGTSRAELAALVEVTATEIAQALETIPAGRLEGTMAVAHSTLPAPRGLLHLATHLAYHLGQVDYHRRLVTGDVRGVGALGISALAD